MWALLAILLAALTLSACHGGGSSNPAPKARVSCADARNPAQAARCIAPRASLLDWILPSAHAVLNFQRGEIHRGEQVLGELSVTSPIDFTGEVEARFDAGCGGEAQWIILQRQPISVTAGQTVTLSASGTCGDMPLGPRTLTVTAWKQDGSVLDQAVVSFTLVE